jgi:prophage antirepressor-like protein
MNNEIQKFDFRGASLRTLTDEVGEPWFVAKDACDILGIDTNHLREALDDDEITNLRNSEVWNQPGRAPLIISEPGLYKLIMRSRKPEAKEFQRWVTHEVLPQIRKTGGYIPTSESDSDEDIGQNRLFRLLRADGYLGKSGSNRNVPTQRAMDLGLFRIKETTVTHADGRTTVSRTPKVTGKGQRYFIDRYWGRAQPTLEAGA